MEKQGWKVLAIILIVLLLAENLLIYWRRTGSEYPDAWLDNNDVCYCYGYDVMGNQQVEDSKLMK